MWASVPSDFAGGIICFKSPFCFKPALVPDLHSYRRDREKRKQRSAPMNALLERNRAAAIIPQNSRRR
jgi:hypothetical protein